MRNKKNSKKVLSLLGASVIGGSLTVAAVAQACSTNTPDEEQNLYNRNLSTHWRNSEATERNIPEESNLATQFQILEILLGEEVNNNLFIGANRNNNDFLSTFNITNYNESNLLNVNSLLGIFAPATTSNVLVTNSGQFSTVQNNSISSINFLNYWLSIGGLAYSLIVDGEGWNSFFVNANGGEEDPNENLYFSSRETYVNRIITILNNSRYIEDINRFLTGNLAEMVIGSRAFRTENNVVVNEQAGFLPLFLNDLRTIVTNSTDPNFNIDQLDPNIFTSILFDEGTRQGSINEGVWLRFYRNFLNTLPAANEISFTGRLETAENSNGSIVNVNGITFNGVGQSFARNVYDLTATRVYSPALSEGEIPPGDTGETTIFLGITRLVVINEGGEVLFLNSI